MSLLSVFDNTQKLEVLRERRLRKWGYRKQGLNSTTLAGFFLTIVLTILLGHSLSNINQGRNVDMSSLCL